MRATEKAILKTLAYADIFDYPLKKGEIWKYLITKNKPDGLKNSKFDNGLEKLTSRGLIKLKDGYYFLAGRKKIVELRKKREKWSREKVKKAKRVAGLLKVLPTVKLVGISGALAMENCDKDDDIDLFIITAGGRLWLTRFLVTLLVELSGQRRRPFPSLFVEESLAKEKPFGLRIFNPKGWGIGGVGELAGLGNARLRRFAPYKDKICLNMFVDEGHLAIPPKERNLFTSHEVVQMRKIWDRGGVYQRFLGENRWVRDYLPNALPGDMRYVIRDTKKKLCPLAKWLNGLMAKWLDGLEKMAMVLQLKYMSKRRTSEKISPGRILFHPEDKGEWVMREYEKRIKTYSD